MVAYCGILCRSAVYVAVLITAISSPVVAETATDLLSEGITAAANGDLAAARVALEKCVSLYPETQEAARASWKLGYIAIKKGELAVAEQRFAWTCDRHPSSSVAPDATLRLAYLAKKTGRPDALARFLDVVLRYPDTPEAQLAKFRAARLQSKNPATLAEACGSFQGVKESTVASIEVRAQAAALEGMAHLQKWYKTGEFAELESAITLLDAVQGQYPKETKGVAWSRFRLGFFFIHEGHSVKDQRFKNNPRRGRTILEEAIGTFPENYFTWWMKSEVVCSYLIESKYEEAASQCSAILAESPPGSWREYLMYVLADCQMRLGRSAEALATFQQLALAYPRGEWGKTALNRIRSLGE